MKLPTPQHNDDLAADVADHNETRDALEAAEADLERQVTGLVNRPGDLDPKKLAATRDKLLAQRFNHARERLELCRQGAALLDRLAEDNRRSATEAKAHREETRRELLEAAAANGRSGDLLPGALLNRQHAREEFERLTLQSDPRWHEAVGHVTNADREERHLRKLAEQNDDDTAEAERRLRLILKSQLVIDQ
ncbi:hypothetical protein [Botrimarina sp.]|uniref:hypothetical protein n=1 Tax=Botrimarina sp. TaxID=2795802 RepID=UPI0032F023E2